MPAKMRSPVQWLRGGSEFFPAILAAIGNARRALALETYIFADDRIGRRTIEALVRAAERGVRVRVLADAFGSVTLPADYFAPLTAAFEKLFSAAAGQLPPPRLRAFRLTGCATVVGAREIFAAALAHSRQIELHSFHRSQNFWQRFKNRWAHFLLARIDPLVALRQT